MDLLALDILLHVAQEGASERAPSRVQSHLHELLCCGLVLSEARRRHNVLSEEVFDVPIASVSAK